MYVAKSMENTEVKVRDLGVRIGDLKDRRNLRAKRIYDKVVDFFFNEHLNNR